MLVLRVSNKKRKIKLHSCTVVIAAGVGDTLVLIQKLKRFKKYRIGKQVINSLKQIQLFFVM